MSAYACLQDLPYSDRIKYAEVQTEKPSKGFGTSDFSRRDEFSNTCRTEQYRTQLKVQNPLTPVSSCSCQQGMPVHGAAHTLAVGSREHAATISPVLAEQMEGKHAKKCLATAISAPASTAPMNSTLSETTRPKDDALFFDRVGAALKVQVSSPTITKHQARLGARSSTSCYCQ